jgi:hypothetical protein
VPSVAYAILALLALVPVPPQRPAVVAIEVTFATHAGEGAVGRKRFDRDGCYQSEAEGGTGGGARAHDSEAGCHRAEDVERVFALIAALPLRAELVPAKLPDEHNRIVVVRADDTRWIPTDDQGARELLRLVNGLPSENQWYAQPPANPAGKTAQLVALSVSETGGASGVRRLEAVVAADGRWWCHRSVPAGAIEELQLARKRPKPLSPAEAQARLANITAGLSPPGSGRDNDAAAARTAHGINRTVEVAFAGGPRAPARPRHKAADVAKRFEARMRPMAATCALP